jgi:hypothetical protein
MIYDRIWEKYDRLRPHTESATVDLGYYFKVNALRHKINPSLNQINPMQIVLLNELQYRYGLNAIIIISYLLDVVLLESLAKQLWRMGADCIIYFIMHHSQYL